MADCFLGEIRPFAGIKPPSGWTICDGKVLKIADNQALYALIGTAYGGDGVTSFNIPDLRGRLPVHMGQGNGLTNRVLGQKMGTAMVALTVADIPPHNHRIVASSKTATNSAPGPTVTFGSTAEPLRLYIDGTKTATGEAEFGEIIGNTGMGAAHSNVMPVLVINYIMALVGEFPATT